MESTSEHYLYEYSVIQSEQTDRGERRTPLMYYQSNAVPPQIGSVFNPGEFAKEGYQDFIVLDVQITPRKADIDGVSETTHVTVFVEKLDR